MQSLPKVFLSYAGEDHPWVKSFADEFALRIGENIKIHDYNHGDHLDFGEVGKWIDAHINDASAVVCFISEHYRQKRYTIEELKKSLTEVRRRRLIFVPVMLDNRAKAWWAELRQQGELSALPVDYQFNNFTDARGEPAKITGDEIILMRIGKLAREIRKVLEPRPVLPPRAAVVEPTYSEVFILGHPFQRFSEELAAEADALADAARKQGLRVKMWKDGWLRGNGASGKAEDFGRNAVFVQPLAAGEASDHVAELGKTQRRLASLGIQNPRVVLWLPSEQSDPEFEKQATSDKDLPLPEHEWPRPALRTDASKELAARLRSIFRPSQGNDHPVLQIETVGSPSGSRPDPTAKRLSDELARVFWDIVTDVMPTDASSPWHFWNEQFKAQIANLPGSRAIVAIHDLDVPPSPDRVTNRKKIELKFQQMQEFVLQSSDAGKLKVFWAALVLKNADALPFAKYPYDARYKDWRLLTFERSDESLTSAQPVRPDPNSLGVFRSELSAWGAG